MIDLSDLKCPVCEGHMKFHPSINHDFYTFICEDGTELKVPKKSVQGCIIAKQDATENSLANITIVMGVWNDKKFD